MIPGLTRILKKTMNVFNVTFQADSMAPNPHINRLFPHGAALLITDSFLLLHPHEAARFLKWFRLFVLQNKAFGTWKLCTRPAIREYLLSLVEERNMEDGRVYMQMYESMWYILPDELMECDGQSEIPREEAPVCSMSDGVSDFNTVVGRGSKVNKPMDEDAIAKNDAIMVGWFSGWAMTQLENFRKFHAISSTGTRPGSPFEKERKAWVRKSNHASFPFPSRISCFCEIERKGSPVKGYFVLIKYSNFDRPDLDPNPRRSLQNSSH